MKTFVAMLLFPIIVTAEPGSVTQYLMNEPATLLDVGMVRLDTLTTEFEKRVGLGWTENEEMKFFRAEVNVQYEPDDDRIYVGFLIMNSEPSDAQMEEACENAMWQMSIWLRKSLPGLFLHIGYDDPSKPPDLYKAFQEIIVLRCYFSSARDTSQGRFWASRSLGDRKMTIGNWNVSQ